MKGPCHFLIKSKKSQRFVQVRRTHCDTLFEVFYGKTNGDIILVPDVCEKYIPSQFKPMQEVKLKRNKRGALKSKENFYLPEELKVVHINELTQKQEGLHPRGNLIARDFKFPVLKGKEFINGVAF